MNSSKRRRVEAEAEKAGYVRLVDEAPRQLVGGQKLLLESDLTKLLESKGLIHKVQGVVEVTVQMMDGGSFGVTLEEGGTVTDLKSEIQEAQGTALYRQQLFMLGEGVEEGSEAQEPLSDDQEIRILCMVMLCVQAGEAWSWDASSPLLERKVFELQGPNNSIAAKIDQNCRGNNCAMAGPAMEAVTGKHAISMQLEGSMQLAAGGLQGGGLQGGGLQGGGFFCGVLSDGAACDQFHGRQESTMGWFMYSASGACAATARKMIKRAGEIEPGAVLTTQFETDDTETQMATAYI